MMLSPVPVPIQKIMIIKHEIKKFTIPLRTCDNGMISLGKYTFLIIPPFALIELVPIFTMS